MSCEEFLLINFCSRCFVARFLDQRTLESLKGPVFPVVILSLNEPIGTKIFNRHICDSRRTFAVAQCTFENFKPGGAGNVTFQCKMKLNFLKTSKCSKKFFSNTETFENVFFSATGMFVGTLNSFVNHNQLAEVRKFLHFSLFFLSTVRRCFCTFATFLGPNCFLYRKSLVLLRNA